MNIYSPCKSIPLGGILFVVSLMYIMFTTQKKKALARLKKAKGQLDGIIRLIEGDAYCPKVLTQLLATQGALRGTASLILESHLNTCAAKGLASGNPKDRDKFITELIKAFELSHK